MASFQGTVTSYGMKKGYGFIASDQIQGDVFFLRTSLPTELAEGFYPELDFQLKGSRVAFTVQRSQSGKSEAIKIKFVAEQGKPVVGEVKTFSSVHGYGFITSSSVDGLDVLFSGKDVPPILQGTDLKGQKCVFKVHEKPDGKLQANDLKFKRIPASQLALMGGGMGLNGMFGSGVLAGYGKGFGKGSGKGGFGKGDFGKGGNDPEPGAQGMVITYNPSKGYGFIKSSRASSDIYFKEQGSFQPGMVVAFNLKTNRDGKPSAIGLKPGLGAGQSYVGTVKAFLDGKGFGFLEVADNPADVYFHKDLLPAELAGSSPVGKRFRFTVQVAADGKARAEHLSAC